MDIILAFVFLFIVTGIGAGLTGAGFPKGIRRLIVPGFVAVVGVALLRSLSAVNLAFRSIPQYLGYGMPDAATGDKGSALARFWVKRFPNDLKKAQIFTRGSVGFLDGLFCSVIPMLKSTPGVWALWAWAAVALVAANVIPPVFLPKLGQINIKGIKLNWHEIIIAGASSCIVIALAALAR